MPRHVPSSRNRIAASITIASERRRLTPVAHLRPARAQLVEARDADRRPGLDPRAAHAVRRLDADPLEHGRREVDRGDEPVAARRGRRRARRRGAVADRERRLLQVARRGGAREARSGSGVSGSWTTSSNSSRSRPRASAGQLRAAGTAGRHGHDDELARARQRGSARGQRGRPGRATSARPVRARRRRRSPRFAAPRRAAADEAAAAGHRAAEQPGPQRPRDVAGAGAERAPSSRTRRDARVEAQVVELAVAVRVDVRVEARSAGACPARRRAGPAGAGSCPASSSTARRASPRGPPRNSSNESRGGPDSPAAGATRTSCGSAV